MSPSTDFRENREFATELKFSVHPDVAARIQDWAREHLQPDPNAGGPAGDNYRVTTLYFDTPQRDVFHRRASFGRSKFRIRRYGVGDMVFLERKARTRTLLSKRRSLIPLAELPRLAGPYAEPGWPGFWLHRRLRLRQLSPVCQLRYDRTARVAPGPHGPIRLTLDRDLRGLLAGGMWFSDEPGTAILPDTVIMELKFRREAPLLFKRLIEEFALSPATFSKYRHAAARLGLVPAGTVPAAAETLPAYA